MDVGVTHEGAAPRKHPVVLENGVLASRLRENDPGIEVDQMRVRTRPGGHGTHHIVHAVCIVAGGTGGARQQVPTVPASRGCGPP